MFPQAIALDPTLHSQEVLDIKRKLLTRTIGQDHAVDKLAMIIETYKARYNDPKRPVGVVLELGPTGTGMTRCVRPAGPKTPRAHAAGDPSLTLRHFTRPRASRVLRCSDESLGSPDVRSPVCQHTRTIGSDRSSALPAQSPAFRHLFSPGLPAGFQDKNSRFSHLVSSGIKTCRKVGEYVFPHLDTALRPRSGGI